MTAFDLHLAIDPDLTPAQQTHRLALEVSLLEHEMDPCRALSRALRCYERAASRPRKIACWEFVSQQLWNARQDALHSGVLDRDSERYREISHRYSDARRRCEFGHLLEDFGHSYVRV